MLCYADDKRLIFMANSKQMLEIEAERTYFSISRAIAKKGLEIAYKQPQIVILNGERRLKEIEIDSEGTVVKSQECIRYLDVIFDKNLRMTKRVEYVTKKADKTITALSTSVPKVDGRRESKRKMLCAVGQFIILYGAVSRPDALKQ